ncbi:MAG: PKD domain-containing protein [bacterium]|nr:PKD domain-containing protein [bacterium]
MKPTIVRPRHLLLSIFVIFMSLILAVFVSFAQESTETPTPEPVTEVPTEAPTEVPTEVSPEAVSTEAPPSAPIDPQTYCQMNVDDLGDNNSFTYRFSAVNVANITGYLWKIDGVDRATTQTFDYTFTATGDYTLELTCVPASGPNLVLTGSISISTAPVANFEIRPANIGFAPFVVSLVNTSLGDGLTFQWEIVTMPAGAGPFQTYTSRDATYTFTVYGIYTIRLTATDGAGLSTVMEQQVAVNARAPRATFNLSPAAGIAPLSVTVLGVDQGVGPITSWSWDINGDGTADRTGEGPHNFTFSAEGSYSIRLDYSGPGGSGFVIKQVVVSPVAGALVAEFTVGESRTVVGGVEVCFTNQSTGPIARNLWNFGDGSPVVENNDAVVCHIYANSGSRTVTLRVQNSANTATAERQRPISVIGAPVAAFTSSVSTVTWGGTVNFTNNSTGVINTYAWDFDGDGTIDSTEENPSNIAIGNLAGTIRLGANPVRLTVTGPGGSSFVEAIIMVQQRSLTCGITGAAQVLPGAAAQTYTATIGEARGRTVNTRWTLTGSGINQSFTNVNSISYTFVTEGTYLITLEAETADGASCSETLTVSVMWPGLNCQMSGPATIYPDGTNRNYQATVQNLAGRTVTYEWFLNGTSVQNGASDTYTLSSTVNNSSAVVRYVATASSGASCEESINVSIQWPTLTCSIGLDSDGLSPRPGMPSDPGGVRNHTYTANTGNVAGRPLTYEWRVNGTVVGSGTSITQNWDWTNIGQNYLVELVVTADNGSGNGTTSCTAASRNLTVTLPTLTCNAPTGDTTPVVGESVTFGRNLANAYGRPWSTGSSATSTLWDFQRWNTLTSAWEDVSIGQTGDGYAFNFANAGERYRVRYAAAVNNPSENCQSNWQEITVAGVGNNFTCDRWVGGNLSPANPASSYSYTIDMDNTTGINLRYRWYLVGEGADTLLQETTSTADGTITSPSFSGAQLGPNGIGDYVLRVDVSPVNPAASTHSCSLQNNLAVGTFSVSFTYTGNRNAIETGQQICLDNTSTASFNGIDGLLYEWNFGTTDNSTGAPTTTAQEPGCFSFTRQGPYTLTLNGRNTSGTRTNSQSVVFQVWDAQSILINRTDSFVYAGNTLSFTSTGNNINTYSWNFYNVATGVRVGTANRTGTSMNQYFATAGQYRAVVVGNGPLGNTTAELMFELINTSDIRAAFIPERYAGLVPMTICFDDNSIGTNIIAWRWNFANGEVLNYTNNNRPAQVCTTFNDPGRVYNVSLEVENAAGQRANATNIVRTYTVAESESTFTITPVNGSRYCYTAVLAAGTTLAGWEFGDGTTAGATSPICYNYAAAGLYVVRMRIVTTGGPGEIVRIVTVNPGGGPVPAISITGICSAQRTATFEVRNTGGAMSTPDELMIRDRNGAVLTIQTLQLAAGETRTFAVSNQSGAVTASTVDTSATANTACEFPPALRVAGTCQQGNVMFAIYNDDGPMIAPQNYLVRTANGTTVASGSFNMARGAAPVEVVLSGQNPYEVYNFTTTGIGGNISVNSSCGAQPLVAVRAVCSTPVSFVIENRGPGMVAPQSYQIVNSQGVNVTPANATFQLAASTTTTVTLAEQHVSGTFTFSTSGAAGSLSLSQTCSHVPTVETPTPMQTTSTSGNPSDGSAQTIALSSSVDGVTMPDWASLPVCGHRCPVFRLYHTDETGNWEIFRLDSADETTRQSQRVNLSLGQGEGVNDMAPSLSPNEQWIVFSSNRATEPGQPENWELYVAPTSGGDPEAVQRVTYNTVAIDTDPIWGPNNFVVFETTRNGNWDLYAIDMTTGQEYQLTDSPADDINAFWSQDGSRLLFQSNRDGDKWQIYELNLFRGTMRKLSDGTHTDVDPQYSPDGQQIVFRTYTEGNPNSQIALMNHDGTNMQIITQPQEDATNAVFSPDGELIAYQSNKDGDLDVYIYSPLTGVIRQLTDNTIPDYAPTWLCSDYRVVFTSDIAGNPDIYEANAVPLLEPAIAVEQDADQMTFEVSNDIYPENAPAEENASREGQTVIGAFGEQTVFLRPMVEVTNIDLSLDGITREQWETRDVCPISQ